MWQAESWINEASQLGLNQSSPELCSTWPTHLVWWLGLVKSIMFGEPRTVTAWPACLWDMVIVMEPLAWWAVYRILHVYCYHPGKKKGFYMFFLFMLIISKYGGVSRLSKTNQVSLYLVASRCCQEYDFIHHTMLCYNEIQDVCVRHSVLLNNVSDIKVE